MKKKNFFIFILVFCLLLINLSTISATDILKPAQVNETYTVLQTCASCTYVNVTISSVQGVIVSNQEMEDLGGGVWAYNVTPAIISRHDVNGKGDLNGDATSFTTYFEVTPSGKTASTGDAILYGLFSFILFFIIFTMAFFIFSMPSRNERNEDGEEFKIVKIKYIRVMFIAFLYPLTILLLNFLNGLAVNFSALTMFAGIIGFLFEMLLRLSWPFTIIILAWIIVMLVHDTNVSKNIKKFDQWLDNPFKE